MKKYSILTNDKITFRHPENGRMVTVYRIIAERDFKVSGTIIGVKAGHIGGFIESEDNLPHDDESWVAHNAKVFDNAKLINGGVALSNAAVYGNSVVNHSVANNWTRIFNTELVDSQVNDNCWVYESKFTYSIVKNTCKIKNCNLSESRVWGGAFLRNSTIHKTFVGDTAQVLDSTLDNCKIYGETTVNRKTLSNETKQETVELVQSYPPLPGDNTDF